MTEFIREGTEADVLSAMSAIAGDAEMAERAVARLQDFDADRLAAAINDHGVGRLGKERALVLLSESRSWNTSNDLFSRVVMPLFPFFTREDVERVVRMPTQTGADLPGAGGYRKFVDEARDTLIPAADLHRLLQEHRGDYLVPRDGQ